MRGDRIPRGIANPFLGVHVPPHPRPPGPPALPGSEGSHCARLFVLGKAMPWIDGGERFWGRSVLVPLGHRPAPDFSESALRTLVGVSESDLLVIRHSGCERIPQDCFGTLTHGSLRLAMREAAT